MNDEFQKLCDLAIQDLTLSSDEQNAHAAGDAEKAGAAAKARADLVPDIRNAEEGFLRKRIEALKSDREALVQSLRPQAGNAPLELVETTIKRFTESFDNEISQMEQQLEANLKDLE
jgi:hypothetical protein